MYRSNRGGDLGCESRATSPYVYADWRSSETPPPTGSQATTRVGAPEPAANNDRAPSRPYTAGTPARRYTTSSPSNANSPSTGPRAISESPRDASSRNKLSSAGPRAG